MANVASRPPRHIATTRSHRRTMSPKTQVAAWIAAASNLRDDARAFSRELSKWVRGSGRHLNSGGKNSAPTRAPNGAIDLRMALVYAVAMFVFNWALRVLLVEPVAKRLLGFADGKAMTRGRRAKVEKFAQSALEMVTYGAFSVFGMAIVPQQTWFWPSASWWIGFPKKTLAVDGALRCYYLAYGARYAAGALNVLLEHKRKDFWSMQIHHFATIGVIWVSYAYGWTRVGAIIMLVLDPADVPLHAAKCAKYIGDARGKKKFQLAADVLFGIFLVTFFVMRLVMYPYVVWSSHFEARNYFPPSVGYWTCVVLLYIILALQVYWFKLILNVVHRVLVTGSAEDVRSDDEDEDEDDETSAARAKKNA